MRWRVLLLAVFALTGCTGGVHTYALNGAYGTLAYKGLVSRTSDGADFVYTVTGLILRFEPSGRGNATQRISAPELCFVTTIKPPGPGSWTRTFNKCLSTQLRLDAVNRTGEIKGTKFVVPKDKVLSADQAGLTLIDRDSNLAWPIHEDLRN